MDISEIFKQHMQEQQRTRRENFRRANPFLKKGQIVFAGSSLMEQFPIHEFITNRNLSLTIYNRGIGGYVADDLLSALEDCILDLEPSHLFLNIGTNDFNFADYQEDVFVSKYEKILQRVYAALPKIYLHLLAFYPVNPKVMGKNPWAKDILACRTNARIASASRRIEQLCPGYDAEFLDLNAGIMDAEGNLKEEFTMDGIHLYADGYHKIFEALLPVLENLR